MKQRGRIAIDKDSSLKRLAWAFGTAKRESREEQVFLDLLLTKVQRMLKEPEPRVPTCANGSSCYAPGGCAATDIARDYSMFCLDDDA